MTADGFLSHFEQVFECTDSECHTDNNILNDEFLDNDISFEEVNIVIKNLKSNKACGTDDVIGELFTHSFDIIYPFVLKLLNVIFSKGMYPDSRCTGIVSPIFMKGNVNIADNYRGVTLINIFAKIYSHVLNNRLLKWSSTNNKIVNNQFGFQPQKSTIDCLFIFHSIISKALQNGNKLYCAFVDFSKAFDRIDRNFLWIKLFEGGISTKMLNAGKAMYETVKSVIKYNNNFTRSFDVFNGVKQGDPLSPILFIFFINDLVNNIKPNSELDLFFIDNLPLFALLYADDAVIFESLQICLIS